MEITFNKQIQNISLQVGDIAYYVNNPTTVNNSSLLGYYAEIKLSNESTEKAELFALGSEITQSSK